MEFVVLALLCGTIIGLLSFKTTCTLITTRVKEPIKNMLISENQSIFIWMSFFSLCFSSIAFLLFSNKFYSIEFMIMFSVFICIAVVDFIIKKIPNELLLLLIANKLIFILIPQNEWNFKNSIAGFIVGLIIFLLPSMLKINIGMGDIKYAAVLGFCIGLNMFLQTIIIMSLTLGIFTIYLYLSKKGNLKTSVPMGPFLSLGAIISGLFTIINFNI